MEGRDISDVMLCLPQEQADDIDFPTYNLAQLLHHSPKKSVTVLRQFPSCPGMDQDPLV